MDFHLSLEPEALPGKIQLRDRILLSGSCFTEHMAKNLRNFKFQVLENPHGILFNPVSIAASLNSYIGADTVSVESLFQEHELWSSWAFHSRYSHQDRVQAAQAMNQSIQQAHHFLKQTNWIILTLGSAFVYQHQEAGIVANCHKLPAAQFKKRLLSAEEVQASLEEMIYRLKLFNPLIKVIFTISPVRHLRDGLIENNRSKAVLIQSVHHLVEKFENLFYFPAYELVVDDLRDYRFYAEDMVHPNYQATEYVWQKFTQACIAPESRETMKEISKIKAATRHHPLHPESAAHKSFMQKHLELTYTLCNRFPFLDFSEEIGYFTNGS